MTCIHERQALPDGTPLPCAYPDCPETNGAEMLFIPGVGRKGHDRKYVRVEVSTLGSGGVVRPKYFWKEQR